MAITMSGATVDQSARESLRSSYVEGISGGETANRTFFGGATGASLAGITDSFATHVSSAIDEYVEKIINDLNKLESVNSQVAFKGAAVNAALSRFVTAVKEVSISYTNKLKEAETEIVNNVHTAYQSQDADLSGNLDADSGALGGNNI